MSTEVRFLGYTVGLYACFIYWGYLQEKLTSTNYKSSSSTEVFQWDYAFALNFFMAVGGSSVAALVEMVVDKNMADKTVKKQSIPFNSYWKAAISSTLASPIGYAALKYISFPLVVLAKSSKPVPVIFVGMVFYGRTFTWYKMLGVALLCGGIALFSSAKGGSVKSSSVSTSSSSGSDTSNLLSGIFLVSLNLLLDGYTNNEQDLIFDKLGATSLQMMKNVNMWTTVYISVFLSGGWFLFGENSELSSAYRAFTDSHELRYDILLFCVCAAVGQVLIFAVMKEFGSLAWITISITRKLFTILFSVFMFNHSVKMIQWFGIALVFLGMIIEVYMGYRSKAKQAVVADEKLAKKLK